MRIKGINRCCLTIVLLLAAFTCAVAQESKKEQTIVPMKGDFFVAFTTVPGADSKNADGWSMTFAEAYFQSNTIRPVFTDTGGSLHFGYARIAGPFASG